MVDTKRKKLKESPRRNLADWRRFGWTPGLQLCPGFALLELAYLEGKHHNTETTDDNVKRIALS